jgi:phospholipase C
MAKNPAMHPPATGPSRRQLIAALSAAGALGATGGIDRALAGARTISRAASTGAAGSDLGAVEHVIFLMQENRSYDHYFGAYPKGRGFDDHPRRRLGVFAQPYPKGTDMVPPKVLLPFRLHRPADECTRDLDHSWGTMHKCWNHGRMDSWARVHTSAGGEGDPTGALTMGYFTRKELPFHYSLADHFTLGDAYFCSILGQTHPNRLMQMSGTIDPAGKHGGPVTDTNVFPEAKWSASWPSVPEILEDKGISWKVYQPSNADLATMGVEGAKYADLTAYPIWQPEHYDPNSPSVMLTSDNILLYFKAFRDAASPLHHKAFAPTFPAEFYNDVQAGTLPAVSWIIPPLGFDEHPSASPDHGMWFISSVLDLLTSNRKVWSKTVLFVMYDENDGMFDHVSPPTAPKGTPGEWLTAPDLSDTTDGIRGPLGLGVRVPLLVVSPFSRGGHIASETFDHTSQLKFLEQRFDVHVPGISHWRRRTVGDLTSTLFRSRTRTGVPALDPAPGLGAPETSGPCAEALQEAEFVGGSDPTLPTKEQRMPTQDGRTIAAHRFRDVGA